MLYYERLVVPKLNFTSADEPQLFKKLSESGMNLITRLSLIKNHKHSTDYIFPTDGFHCQTWNVYHGELFTFAIDTFIGIRHVIS